ncbi:hypothetical protein DFW101_2154 [Solidesulfovibrio carbinoliphilus subsp. oakridgensis]|uniref:Uncharacterized protein n=1 Tax=Solidesulfovibrio carbinoliphilus subsp. oakridgensis TaxID=694327 RepID=G7Q9B7_9BACT|nr:hypothetical protein [Solidesulfovibrio carbinoliphilus]EHJ48160.1 hypothetical protein DFW101_2154 [Solidesulfovibrio carbinoliphilus subsp. oakridgensis]
MATDKPLADSDDDIIDLTDLVEEGGAGDAPSGDDGPVDMSFEQELEDLFGDADPAAPAAPKAAGPAAGTADEDLIDLAGFDVDETPETAPAPAGPGDNDGDDDVMDLTGFGLDEVPEPAPAQAAATAAANDGDDDVMDLAGLGFDEIPAAPKAPAGAADAAADTDIDDAMADLFGEAEAPARPAATAAATTPDDEAAGLSSLGFELPEDAISLAEAGQTPEDAAEAAGELPDFGGLGAETAPDDEAMDLTGMDLSELEPAPAVAEPPAPADDAAGADLLGDVPYAPDATDDGAMDIADISPLPPLEEPAAPVPDANTPGSTAAGEAAMAALTVAAAAGVTAGVAAMAQSAAPHGPAAATTAIDLGALDNLIDAARGPLPEPEPEAAPEPARLNALAERIASLESTTATLYDKLETLPPATDGEALADALSARLEDALSERLEAVLAGQPPMPDVAGLRTDILAEIERRVPDRDSLLADVQAALAPQFEALRGELPQAGELAGQAETAAALDGLRESLARLEALTQGRQTKFEDFAAAMEARLAELRRELPGPDAYASTQNVSEALETLRENLSRDIAANLDERLAELRRELRETLAGDIAAGLDERVAGLRSELGDSLDARVTKLGGELQQGLADDIAAGLDERLGGVIDAGRQAAATEVRSLGETLASRLEALENDRLDPEAVAERVRQALLPSLPDAEAVQEAGKAAARAEDAVAAAHSRLEDKAGYEDLDAALDTMRTEMAAEIERAVPRAAAAVIREEIAALLKDFE